MTDVHEAEIVGRSEPLRRLGTALSASAHGRRSAMLVSGEAGIGKTSLVRAAIDRYARGAVVGWGTCWPGGGAPGFWPWMQAFGDVVRALGTPIAQDCAGRDGEMLSVLVPELGGVARRTAGSDPNRLLLLDAAVRWLESLATERDVVIVLDDLQWGDASTWDLLAHLVAAPVSARLVVIGAYRHDELDLEAPTRVATLASRADHLHLAGLTVDGVEQLVRKISGPATATRRAAELHRRTGGHPLFVGELARLPADDEGGQLPTIVSAAVGRRVDALPRPTQDTLESASVLGNRLLPDVLAQVMDQPPGVVVEHLAPAVAAGLVRVTGEDEFWFVHDLFRETLYGRLDPTRRGLLHGLVGDALVARGGRGGDVPPSDLALHYAKAARSRDGREAIDWAREAAADERRRSAFAEAAGHLGRARRAVVDAGRTIEPALLVELLMEEADDAARSGDPDGARSLLVAAADVAPDPALGADVALAVQRLGAKFSTRRDAIIDQLAAALDAVVGIDVVREARLAAALARELQHSVPEDRARVGPLSAHAIALGRQSGDDRTLVSCLLARHDALWEPGTGVERAQLGREIAALGGRLGDVDRHAEGLLLEANGLLESGSAAFRPVLDRWFDLLETRGEPRDVYLTTTRRAALALIDGDDIRAEALMEDAARIGAQIHEPDTGNVFMSQRVALVRARDEPDELRSLADEAVRWWTGAPVLAHGVAAGAYAAAGDLDAASHEVAMVAACGGWTSEGSYLRSVLVAHLAEAAAALGDAELCRGLFDDLAPISDGCGVNGAVVAFAGPFAHAAGILAGELGELHAADALLAQSAATARRLGALVWARRSDSARTALAGQPARPPRPPSPQTSTSDVVSMVRSGNVWTISWGAEHAHLTHVKGLADIAQLVRFRGREVPALQLAGGAAAAAGTTDTLVDMKALDDYRRRLTELAAEIDEARALLDAGRVERLEDERERVLAEVRHATGLGGRLRTNANDPAERARKAVTARIRDALRRLEAVAPLLGAHLDRSLRTGLRCTYDPTGEDAAVRWDVQS